MLQTGDIKAARELGRYRAFISYSHVDATIARWLHRALERYRAPTWLHSVERSEQDRLYPIFRDREELPASSDLSSGIVDALTRSDALIVVCSPDAAESKWVDQEIRTFKTLRPAAPVLALIASGEPRASEPDGPPGRECFPLALRREVRADGTVSDAPQEPIAADLRPGGDGRRLARLKIAAGLLGVPVGALVRRDTERQQRRFMAALAAAGALVLILAGLLFYAYAAQSKAAARREGAEGLIEYMVGDLRKQLEPIGKLAIMDSLGERALKYYRDQDEGDLTPDALARRARVLTMLGEIQSKRGNLDKALAYYRQAAASTGELMRREPVNGQRIFDHAQSVYGIGNIYWQRGDIEQARTFFEEYRHLAERLVVLDPKKTVWRAELGYAYSNLGTLFYSEGKNEAAAAALESSLAVSKMLAAGAADDVDLQISLAQSYGWVADVDERLGRAREAVKQRELEGAIYDKLLDRDSGNLLAQQYKSTVDRTLSRLATEAGDYPRAQELALQSAAIADKLEASDPNNMKWTALAARSHIQLADVLRLTGEMDAAQASIQRANRSLSRLLAQDRSAKSSRQLYARSEIASAEVALVEHQYATAFEMAVNASTEIENIPRARQYDSEDLWLLNNARFLAARAAAARGDETQARDIQARLTSDLQEVSSREKRFQNLLVRSRTLPD